MLMAGGIDWFRWHHGSTTDPKFQLVARKAGASLPDVLAVWAHILEAASSSSDRGNFGPVDCEAIDCLFGFPDCERRTENILSAMFERSLISEDDRIVAWDKRQPRREDETANERKRRQREREHEQAVAGRVTQESSRDVTQGHADVTQGHADVTQGHADVTQGHARGEERRVEKKKKTTPKQPTVACPLPEGVDLQVWSDWLALRKAKRAPVTPTVVASATAEAAKAGMTLDAFLRAWCARGSQGFQADWMKTTERQPAGQETAWQRGQRDRVHEMTGGLASRKAPGQQESFIDMETTNAITVD